MAPGQGKNPQTAAFAHLTTTVPPYGAVEQNAIPDPQEQSLPQVVEQDPAATRKPRVYRDAVPVGSLMRVPAPVDCPACGARALTKTSYEVGSANQYAIHFNNQKKKNWSK